MTVLDVFARARDRKPSTSETMTLERAQAICLRPQDYQRSQLLEAARCLHDREDCPESDMRLAERALDWLRHRAPTDRWWMQDQSYATSGLSGIERYFTSKEKALHAAQRRHDRTGERIDVIWCADGFGTKGDLWLNTVDADGVHDVTIPEVRDAVIRRDFATATRPEQTGKREPKQTAVICLLSGLFLVAIYRPSWLHTLPGWAWFLLALFIGGFIDARLNGSL
jgi:hypothetical protein